MLTSIQPALAARPYTATSAPAPKSDPAAAEPLDLSSIDTPAKAAALPCVNPALLGVLVTGLIVCSMTSSPATAILSLTLGDQQGNLTYTFNPRNPEQAITANGELGGQSYRETWSLDQEKKQLAVSARLGETPIELKLNAGQQAMLVKGNIGDFTVTQVIGGKEDLSSINSNGQLGNVRFSHDIQVSEDEDRNYLMAVNGKLGRESIEQSVKIGKGEDSDLMFQGSGQVAGTPFAMDGRLYAAQP